MTPLAHQILKQLLLPAKRREFADRGDILPQMNDVHYFDCRSVNDIVSEHWKGDAALGLKLSTYRVEPPSFGENE